MFLTITGRFSNTFVVTSACQQDGHKESSPDNSAWLYPYQAPFVSERIHTRSSKPSCLEARIQKQSSAQHQKAGQPKHGPLTQSGDISRQIEMIQTVDFSANRAMHEDFQEQLIIHPQTKRIFLDCVDVMRLVQRQFLDEKSFSDLGAFAAAQLVVTINYNYVLKAMPGLTADPHHRHRLIGEVVAMTLKR